MVSGGPYGIEDILGGAGFGSAIIILLVLPFVWCLPTALMIGELASCHSRRGWLLYLGSARAGAILGIPGELALALSQHLRHGALSRLFVLYLGKFSPALASGWRGYAFPLAVVVLCCLWNLLGAPKVGEDSVGLCALLLAPFAVFVALGFWRGLTSASGHAIGARPASGSALLHGTPGCLVELHGLGQCLHCCAGSGESAAQLSARHDCAPSLTAVTYILPLAAMAVAGLPTSSFSTGDWTTAARELGGPLLGLAVVAGGCITAASACSTRW